MQRCSVCGVTLATETVSALGHSPMEWVTAVPNGCLTPSKYVQTCSVCGLEIAFEELPALAHAWSEWTIDIEATKSAEGRQSRYCTHCGATETNVIPKEEKFLGIF